MSLSRDIVLALAADLDANASLDPHSTVKGRRPRAILPEDCPLLVIWLDNKRPSPATTERFDGIITIGISWHEEAVEEAETLIDDEDLSWRLAENIERIEGRIRYLSRAGLGSLLNPWQLLPGAMDLVGPLPQKEGLVEGYALEVTAEVTES
jgi:hypothetical protein